MAITGWAGGLQYIGFMYFAVVGLAVALLVFSERSAFKDGGGAAPESIGTRLVVRRRCAAPHRCRWRPLQLIWADLMSVVGA